MIHVLGLVQDVIRAQLDSPEPTDEAATLARSVHDSANGIMEMIEHNDLEECPDDTNPVSATLENIFAGVIGRIQQAIDCAPGLDGARPEQLATLVQLAAPLEAETDAIKQ